MILRKATVDNVGIFFLRPCRMMIDEWSWVVDVQLSVDVDDSASCKLTQIYVTL